MSVIFYQKGTNELINGLLCNTQMVAPDSFDGENIPEGWFLTPEEAHREITSVDTKAETHEDIEKAGETLKGNAKIRNDAKEAGIKDWEKARIATLTNKLKA